MLSDFMKSITGLESNLEAVEGDFGGSLTSFRFGCEKNYGQIVSRESFLDWSFAIFESERNRF